jgi:hypothetical protein
MDNLMCSFEGTEVRSEKRKGKEKISSGEEFFQYRG